MPNLTLQCLVPADVPDPAGPDFAAFLDQYFAMGEELADTLDQWSKHSAPHGGNTQLFTLPNSGASGKIRKQLGLNDFWAGRMTSCTPDSIREGAEQDGASNSLLQAIGNKLRRRSSDIHGVDRPTNERRPTFELNDVERQKRIMTSSPNGLYESFRRGLLEYHSENEREYIESLRESECLQVLQPHVAEIWRMTYVTPAPTNPRTFVTLLLSRELKSAPHGERSFMNVSIPFLHPDCPEKVGDEKSRVRGRYVSVELVREHGEEVEWRMATSSDAGGNIPRFMVNSSLPGKIAEDVPSFIGWLAQKDSSGTWRKSTLS